MQPSIPSLFDPFNVDVQLISAVQTHAGARCHEAANLLACYSFWADLHRQALRDHDARQARTSRGGLEESEVSLRRFLFQCRWPERLAHLI